MSDAHATVERAREIRETPAADAGVAEAYDELAAAPPAPDWEDLIAMGVVPALALGAERRLNRH